MTHLITVVALQRDADNSYHRVAGDITSQFESGGDYAKLQTEDRGIVSYGKHQATLSGNLQKVIREYVARSKTDTAAALAVFIPRADKKDKSLRHDKQFHSLLVAAAKESAMRDAQDVVFKKQYWDPAAKRAKDLGVSSALGHALIYDMTIQGGSGGARFHTTNAVKALGGRPGDVVQGKKITEQEFLKAIVQSRIDAALRQSERELKKAADYRKLAEAESDPKKKAALQAEAKAFERNGGFMKISATKTRGPTWMTLVESGDLNLRGDEKGRVKLVGKKTSVRGLKEGATIDGSAAGTPVAGAPMTKTQAAALPVPKPQPASMASIAAIVTAALPPAKRTGGGLGDLLGALAPALASGVIAGLASGGYDDVNKLTNIAFWMRHPELTGTKLDPKQPNFKALSAEWLAARENVVTPALDAARAKPVTKPASKPTIAPAAPKVAPVAAPAAAAKQGGGDFVHNWAASSIDLLPPAQRARFKGITWGWMDFPGTYKLHKELTPAQVELWRGDAALVETTINGQPAFVGKHQRDADALFLALAANRPGGGERRVNLGDTAVLTKEAFQLAPAAFDAFVVKQAKPVPGQAGAKLHEEAGQAFAKMREAANKDGVPLVILSGYRPRGSEVAAAKAARNPKAVGAFSPHSLGLAADLKLHVKANPLEFTETSTGNFKKMLNMMRSPVYKWMYENGAQFGFYQYRAEPWHWEYNPSDFKDRFFDGAPELEQKVAEAAAAAAAKKAAKKKK